MLCRFRISHRVETTTIVDCGVSLSKVVALDFLGVTSNNLNVKLVQIVGNQNKTADDTSSWGGLKSTFDLSKKEIPVRLHGWSIVVPIDSEDSSKVGVCFNTLKSHCPVRWHTLGKINRIRCLIKTSISRTTLQSS
jgi:hypothetical protein